MHRPSRVSRSTSSPKGCDNSQEPCPTWSFLNGLSGTRGALFTCVGRLEEWWGIYTLSARKPTECRTDACSVFTSVLVGYKPVLCIRIHLQRFYCAYYKIGAVIFPKQRLLCLTKQGNDIKCKGRFRSGEPCISRLIPYFLARQPYWARLRERFSGRRGRTFKSCCPD